MINLQAQEYDCLKDQDIKLTQGKIKVLDRGASSFKVLVISSFLKLQQVSNHQNWSAGLLKSFDLLGLKFQDIACFEVLLILKCSFSQGKVFEFMCSILSLRCVWWDCCK